MRAVKRKKQQVGRADPAPSRWAWRMQRLMLTPGFRKLLRVGVPVLVIGGLAGSVWDRRSPAQPLEPVS